MYTHSHPVFLLPKLLLYESLHYVNEISFNLIAAFQTNPNSDADLVLSNNTPNFKPKKGMCTMTTFRETQNALP